MTVCVCERARGGVRVRASGCVCFGAADRSIRRMQTAERSVAAGEERS